MARWAFWTNQVSHLSWCSCEVAGLILILRETFADLLKEYQPMAKASLMEITKSFTGTLSRETSDANAASSVNVAVFIGRVALDLAYESSFAATLTIREDQPYTCETECILGSI